MLLLLRRLIGVHRELIGNAVRELVMELGVVVVVLRERRVVRHVADAELRRVRSGHVRQRSLDDVREACMVRPVARPVVEARNEAGRFIHRNRVRIVRILLRAPHQKYGPSCVLTSSSSLVVTGDVQLICVNEFGRFSTLCSASGEAIVPEKVCPELEPPWMQCWQSAGGPTRS